MGPILGGMKLDAKSMVVLRDSSLNSAFDWVGHIYIDPWLHLVIHCC